MRFEPRSGEMLARKAFLAVLILSSCLGAACGSTSAILRDPPPIAVTPGTPAEGVRDAIYRAIPQHRWVVESEEPGRIVATLYIRTHVARVTITYDAQTVYVQYLDSTNLDFQVDGNGTPYIHRNYLGWVQNLVQDIQYAMMPGSDVQVIVVQ